MGFVSATLTLIAAQKENLTLLAVGLACWGLFQGMVNPSVWALLADSVNSGDRSLYFSKRLELQFYGRTTVSSIFFKQRNLLVTNSTNKFYGCLTGTNPISHYALQPWY